MLERVYSAAARLMVCERGANSMEYALMLALIVIAMLAAFQTLSDSVSSLFGAVNSDFSSAMPGG